MKPKLGVQMFTLRAYTQNANDLDTCLAKVREIGYQSIQVSAFGPIAPEEVAFLCQKHDLDIGGTHVSWGRFQNDLDAVIDEHKLWDCKHTAIGMIPPADYMSIEGLQRFLKELEPVSKGLTAADMTFSYHNHNHEFLHFDGKPWLQHLLDQAPAEVLKMELDTHWVVAGGGDPAIWVDKCGDRMPLLHLKDFKVNADYRRNFAPIGDGNMNWPVILEAAARHPIEYYFIEQDNCYGEDEFACLKRSYDFLNQEYGLK
ncbi:MAG: sugar phosphate isomerase/epimerase [Pseudomonadales bacterium]